MDLRGGALRPLGNPGSATGICFSSKGGDIFSWLRFWMVATTSLMISHCLVLCTKKEVTLCSEHKHLSQNFWLFFLCTFIYYYRNSFCIWESMHKENASWNDSLRYFRVTSLIFTLNIQVLHLVTSLSTWEPHLYCQSIWRKQLTWKLCQLSDQKTYLPVN